MLKGDIASAQLQLDNALAAYRKTLELRPDSVAAHSKIASTLIQQGKIKEASLQIDAMKKVAPKHPQTLYLQALIALREKNYVAAREAIQLHLRAAPDSLAGLVLEGSIAYHLGSYAQAETSLKKALQKAPKQRVARMMLVNTYLRTRQPAKALETLKPLLDDGNPGADVLALAGEVYMQTGNIKEAERAFAKASALDPKDASKRTALALTHVSSGDRDRGLKELEEAAAADSGIRADLALIANYTRERKYDAALKAIAALEKKQPDKPLAHNLRGAVYSAKGDTAAARQSFERAITVDPADFVRRGEPRAARHCRQEAGRRAKAIRSDPRQGPEERAGTARSCRAPRASRRDDRRSRRVDRQGGHRGPDQLGLADGTRQSLSAQQGAEKGRRGRTGRRWRRCPTVRSCWRRWGRRRWPPAIRTRRSPHSPSSPRCDRARRNPTFGWLAPRWLPRTRMPRCRV